MSLEDLLSNFAAQTGLPAEQVSGQDTVNLVFDDKTGVQITGAGADDEISFASILFQVEGEDNLAAIALMIAQANYDQADLYGAHLAMNEQGQVVLLRRVPARSITHVDFNRVLAEFVDAAAKWSASIAAMAESLQEFDSPGTDSAPGEMEIGMKV